MNIQSSGAKIIEQAAVFIRDGAIVAFPTETVYGLGADATNDKAVAEIFAAKGRPSFNPLIIHVSTIAMAKKYVEWNDKAEKLAEAFWPGPLTLILPRRNNSRISLLASAGGDTLGVRIPAHDMALALIEAVGRPIAAPSANPSGKVSPTTAQHVRDEFGDSISIVDGGACEVGVESSVLDISGELPILLRPGGITREAIESVLGTSITSVQEKQEMLKSPGLLESHYAPALPVRLNVMNPNNTEALLAFGTNVPEGAKHVINLSETGNDKEAAAGLFAALRELDSEKYSAIAVMPIPEGGLGMAINDRLKRAAAGRP